MLLRIVLYVMCCVCMLLFCCAITYYIVLYVIVTCCFLSIQSISEISSCFFWPRPSHIKIRHRVKTKHPQLICSDLRLSNWKFEDWNYGNRPYFLSIYSSPHSWRPARRRDYGSSLTRYGIICMYNIYIYIYVYTCIHVYGCMYTSKYVYVIAKYDIT